MKLWDKLILSGNLKARPATVNQVAMMVKNVELDAGFVYSSVASVKNTFVIAFFCFNFSTFFGFGIWILPSFFLRILLYIVLPIL